MVLMNADDGFEIFSFYFLMYIRTYLGYRELIHNDGKRDRHPFKGINDIVNKYHPNIYILTSTCYQMVNKSSTQSLYSNHAECIQPISVLSSQTAVAKWSSRRKRTSVKAIIRISSSVHDLFSFLYTRIIHGRVPCAVSYLSMNKSLC